MDLEEAETALNKAMEAVEQAETALIKATEAVEKAEAALSEIIGRRH